MPMIAFAMWLSDSPQAAPDCWRRLRGEGTAVEPVVAIPGSRRHER